MVQVGTTGDIMTSAGLLYYSMARSMFIIVIGGCCGDGEDDDDSGTLASAICKCPHLHVSTHNVGNIHWHR